MNLFLRLFLVALSALFGSKTPGLRSSRLVLRVWPNDLDINFHMNNGRYLSIMDLGRVDMIIRMGALKDIRRNGLFPVMGGIKITYLKSLALFDRFDIVTEVVGWDDKWLYMIQTIERGNELIAYASMKTLFMSKKGRVPINELATILGQDATSPPIPPHVLQSMVRDDQVRSKGTVQN